MMCCNDDYTRGVIYRWLDDVDILDIPEGVYLGLLSGSTIIVVINEHTYYGSTTSSSYPTKCAIVVRGHGAWFTTDLTIIPRKKKGACQCKR